MNDEFTDLPIDLWEMSPDNIVMDETTFFGCGNFGEVYKGCLKIPTKSPTESYPAGKTVAVKLLQGTKYIYIYIYIHNLYNIYIYIYIYV